VNVKKIIIVSHPRSGSSYLNRLLSNFNRTKIVMEPFHQNPDVSSAHIKAATYNKYADFIAELENSNHTVYDYGHSNPVEFVDMIANHSDCDYLSVKIFPGHLSREKLEQLLASAAVVIFLRRNPLHSYISVKIAHKLAVWGGRDTSDIKISIDEASYIKWNNDNWLFMEASKAIVKEHNVAHIDLQYEQLLNMDVALETIRQSLSDRNIYLETGRTMRKNPQVQDSRKSAIDKVTNVEDLYELTKKFRIEHLIDNNESVMDYEKL